MKDVHASELEAGAVWETYDRRGVPGAYTRLMGELLPPGACLYAQFVNWTSDKFMYRNSAFLKKIPQGVPIVAKPYGRERLIIRKYCEFPLPLGRGFCSAPPITSIWKIDVNPQNLLHTWPFFPRYGRPAPNGATYCLSPLPVLSRYVMAL